MTSPSAQDPVRLATAWRECLSLASFWPPEQVGPQPAWLEHAPFAFWLIEALRPATFVELGAHRGSSYFTFCQAIQHLQLETRCFAVDTWRGDEHAGFYGEEVLAEARRYHDRRYSSFSTLVRATFDEAVRRFPDGTIDLLHIDGRHLYDDVKHDFETWRPKLSDRGVVLLHDTNVHGRDFGVFQFWRELSLGHRHFEFLHGHGLGVIAIGERLPPAVDALFRASGDAKAVSQIRNVYSRLGSTVTLELVALEQRNKLQEQESQLRQWKIETDALKSDLTVRTEGEEALTSDLTRRTEEAEALTSELTRRTEEAEALRRDLTRRSAEAARVEGELTDARQRINELSGALKDQQLEAHAMRTSTSWWITRPIRKFGQRYPRLAGYGRRMLRQVHPRAGVHARGLVTDGPEEVRPAGAFDSDFLEPYFHSADFWDAPAVTVGRLREAGWPVYGTRAEVEAVATIIRGSELFDAEEYMAQISHVDEIDPLFHYVIVGERMGLMPSKRFDPTYYRQRYPDVDQAQRNVLAHYVTSGRTEGRRPLSVAADLTFDRSRIEPERETILIISHEASRTGAPIIAYNIARRLGRKYNVVAVMLTGGELVPHFEAACAALVGPLTHADWHPVEATYLVKHLTATYQISLAIANSIESRILLPALAYQLVPVVALVHEFASYTRPEGTMGQALDWSTQIVFPAEVVARAAQKEHPTLLGRPIHVLPQGRCDVPARWRASGPARPSIEDLGQVFRPKGAEGALVVLGCGTVHFRKGVDVFLACAAAVSASDTRRPVRFVWIGHGYDPRRDFTYSCYLADQIARSGLDCSVQILDEIEDVDPAYRLSDVVFLSSRLDPMPNVAIEAALHGIPVVCFAEATGIVEVLEADPTTRRCVVPHLDVARAARVIIEFANDEEARREVGTVTRRLAEATFDMDRYVDRIDQLGVEAVQTMRERVRDLETIREDALFDERFYIPPDDPPVTRDEAIIGYLARSTAVNQSRYAAKNHLFRRPCAGFHPQVYAHECFAQYNAASTNPLADFIRRGKPPGPWSAELIVPTPPSQTSAIRPLRVALHGHFFYPELAVEFMRKLAANRWPCHLLLSTDSDDKAAMLRRATAGYGRGEVLIRVVPNRGRDLGPLLTAYATEVANQYDLIGHLHAKRSLLIGDAKLGENWREFLWQHLLGDRYPMMDTILNRFAIDETIGLVFAADPHLSDWDANLAIATDLADRMGILGPLPPFFDFPIGTMFWARPAALRPLLELKLGWDDYPPEPVAYDGTILHALERLLPFATRRGGYGYAMTHIPDVNW